MVCLRNSKVSLVAILAVAVVLVIDSNVVESFSIGSLNHANPSKRQTMIQSESSFLKESPFATTTRIFSSATPNEEDNDNNEEEEDNDDTTSSTSSSKSSIVMECQVKDENESLKREMFQLAASFDRGFGASSSRVRDQAMNVIEQLERRSDAVNAADSMLTTRHDTYNHSLRGNWRLIWTSAADVLVLQASPFFSVGAIYQCFDTMDGSKKITNVIDFIPRIQSLLPVGNNLPNTLIRANVQTEACAPRNSKGDNNNNRVGLIFQSVQIEPIEVLGMNVGIFPPIGFNLPKVPDSLQASGFFDVTYLDDELLIIRQNAPGGLFVLTKVDSIDS